MRKGMLVWGALLAGQALGAQMFTDPDEAGLQYWVVGSLPSAWVVQAQGEADAALAGSFVTMRLQQRSASAITASCNWYEPGAGRALTRSSFQVTVRPGDTMWDTYRVNFASLTDKPRWLQSLGALCMFKKGNVQVKQVTPGALGVVLAEIPSVRVVPAVRDGLRTVNVVKR